MKLREKLISVVLAVALVAAFVPCSGCVEGNNPIVLTSADLQSFFGQSFGDMFSLPFGQKEDFNSSDPIVGVWRTTKEANPTWDYTEYRIYADGSFKRTSYSKTSSGWSTRVYKGAWVYKGVSELLAPFGYNDVNYHLQYDDKSKLPTIASMNPKNKNIIDADYTTYYRVNA